MDKTKIKKTKVKEQKPKKTLEQPDYSQVSSTAYKVWQPSAVSDEALLQLKVDQRLQELTDLAKAGTHSKIKSQRGGHFEVLVKHRVKWPHEYVLSV